MTTICIVHVLPYELVERILAELTLRDILRCKQVCRWFNGLIRTSVVLQWKLESLLEGVTYVGSHVASLQDRVSLLRQQKNEWETLDWERFGNEAFEGPMDAYCHVGGIFGLLSAGQLTTLHLPSKLRPDYIRTTRTLGFPAREFVLDPTQDLAIFLAINDTGADNNITLHILSFSTLKPHPEARLPQILVPDGRNLPQQKFYMHLNQDVVAVILREVRGILSVWIWNWKQGTPLIHWLVTRCHQEGFAILTPNIYLFTPVHYSGYISINSISPHKEIVRLKLPNLATNASMSILTLDTAPTLANPLEGRHFQANLENQLYSLELIYYSGQFTNLRAFVLAKTLLQYAKTDEEPEKGQKSLTEEPGAASYPLSVLDFGEEPDGVRIVPWEDWGPDNVRMMENLPYFKWHCSTNTSRTVLPLLRYKPVVRVLDFNVPKSTTKRETVINDTSLFEEDVVSRLPYRSCVREAPEGCQDHTKVSFILDDERVVVIRKTQDGAYDIIPLAIN